MVRTVRVVYGREEPESSPLSKLTEPALLVSYVGLFGALVGPQLAPQASAPPPVIVNVHPVGSVESVPTAIAVQLRRKSRAELVALTRQNGIATKGRSRDALVRAIVHWLADEALAEAHALRLSS